MTFRTYHEVAGDDRSRLAEQVGAQRARILERLRPIKRVVAIMSGKGGVGKSFVAASLATELARRVDGGVGVLDADLASPTTARMLDARGPLRVDERGVHPAVGCAGVRVCSTDLLLDEGSPLRWKEPESERFIWRGILETGALREFLGDVVWGALDLLLIDLPPGSDRLDDLATLVPGLTGAVAVTIPSEESRRSVERAMQRARDAGIPLLGVVENMSAYRCGDCGASEPLFDGRAGAQLSDRFAVPLLASVPFCPVRAHAARHAAFDALATSFLGVVP